MISLNSARSLVREVKGEELSLMYTDLTLRDWARQGIISRMEVEAGKAMYPDIVAAEILTALNLKSDYKLSEIAEARKCLELEGGHQNQITEADLIRFINCSKLFNDKKLVTKLTVSKIDSLETIKELIDDLLAEKQHLEIVGSYLKEFLKAEKKLKEVKAKSKEAQPVST